MKQKQKQQPTASLAAKPRLPGSRQKVGTFADHIAELRRRLVLIAVVFVMASALAYTYHEALTHLIMAPLKGQKLVYLTPGGGFSFIFQVSIYAGLIVAAPFIVHHIYAFIKPALPSRAQRSAGKVVLTALALIVMGICYGYFVAVPAALHFLSGFAGDSVTPNLTADSYLNFFLSYIAGLALLSLLPLFLIFWHWIRPLTPGGLLKSERWVILLAFIAAAIITPTPDAANQTMIAGPVILLYQVGVAAVMLSVVRHRRADRRTASQATESVSEAQLEQLLGELHESAPTAPAAASTTSRPVNLSRKYLDIAIPNSPTKHHQVLQPQPISTQPQQASPPSSNLQRPRRSMDIIPRHARPAQARPASIASYTQRTVERRAPSRPQLSLDGIFAPMQAA